MLQAGFDYEIANPELPPAEIYLDEEGTKFPSRRANDMGSTTENDTTPAHNNLKTRETSCCSKNSTNDAPTDGPKAPRPTGDQKNMFTFDGYSHSVATQESRDELVAIKTSSLEAPEAAPKWQRVITVIRSEESGMASTVKLPDASTIQKTENDEQRK